MQTEPIILKNPETGKSDFGCPFCEKQTTKSKAMKEHIRIHTGERPYICPVCNFTFSYSSNYYKHIRTKHPTFSGENK